MNIDLEAIARTAREHDLPIPEYVDLAEALLSAAEELQQRTATETPPDITTATAKNLTKLHAALVEYDTQTEHRQRHAAALVEHAKGQREQAWGRACHPLMPLFGEKYNAAAVEFTDRLASLGGTLDASFAVAGGKGEELRAAVDAGQRLAGLRHVRDCYAGLSGNQHRADVGQTGPLEPLSRVMVVPDHRTLQRIAGLTESGPEWFAALVGMGIRLEWHDKAEQEALAAEFHRNTQAAKPGYLSNAPAFT